MRIQKRMRQILMKIRVNKKNSAVALFLMNVVLFIILTMPFKLWVAATELTDMRPSTAMTPVLGMIFGWPAAFGCGVGNLLCDLISGYEFSYACISFLQQLLYAMVPFYLWKHLNPERDGREFSLNRVSRILKFALVLLVDAVLIVICTGLLNHVYNVISFFSMDNLYLLINSFDSGILFGTPLLILGNLLQRYIQNLQNDSKEKVVRFSLNERMILNTIITGLIICVVVGGVVYLTNRLSAGNSNVSLLGQMFLFQTLVLNVYFFLSIGFMYYTETKIARPVEQLAEVSGNYYTEHTSQDKRQELLDVCGQYAKDATEVGELSRSYISMIEDLEKYISNLQAVTREKERINAELNLASDIQAHMLPCIFPPFPEHNEFDIYATMTPAKEVGGDFYDYYMMDGRKLAVVAADVSGKGVPAALFMVITKVLIKNHVQLGLEPAEVFEKVNNLLCEGNDADLFVTAWLGVLDLATGVLTYVNAGHNPPLLKKEGGDFEYLRCKPALVLAGMEMTKYTQSQLEMKPGDSLFLYTDGVTEATNTANELYGEERLRSYINAHGTDGVVERLHGLKKDIDTFVGEAPQFDDITMLALDLKHLLKNNI